MTVTSVTSGKWGQKPYKGNADVCDVCDVW